MQRSGLMNSRTVVEVIAALIICSLSIPKSARHAFWGLHIWRWFVLIIAIISGSLLSGLFIRIIVFFFERSFNLGKRYLYFAYSVRKTVHNCIWLGLILLAWNFLFNKEVVGETKALSYITKILFCLILATILFLVKTLLFKVLAFSFHVSTYFDRIQIALFNQSIIEILSGPPLVEIQKNMKERERVANYVQVAATNERTMGRSGGNILKGMRIKNSQIEKSLNLSANAWKDFSKQRLQHDGKVTIEQLLKLNKKNISAWNMKRLMRIVRCGTLTIINEQMLLDKEEDESPMHIMSQHDAMVAARKIFINVANYNRKWLTRIVIFFVGRYFFLRIRFLYFVYGVRKSFRSCIWVFMVFLAWIFLFDEKMAGESHVLSQITKIFFCLMVATISRLVKTILLKVLASSFYVNAYFDRIQAALLNQCIVEALSVPLHHESKQFTRSTVRKDFSRRITIDQLHKVDKHNISSWSMRNLTTIIMYGTLTILDDQRRSGLGEDKASMRIISEHWATLAAQKIFMNANKPGAKNIDLNDLEGFFRDDEREKIMCHLGGTPNDGISKIALKNWVVNAYKCRRALTFALNDVKTIMKRLHQIANILVGIIVICIWLFILNIITTQYFVLVGSQIFLATFISRDTLKKIFKSVKFLFTTHPFDVGDHCEVDGAQMVVEEMNLLTTTFLRFDKSKIVLQNSKLVESSIVNFYQGFDMGDKIDFDVHLSTPLTMIELLRERIILFMERSGHWHSGTRVVVQDIDNTEKKLKISIIMKHRLKFHDMEMKLSRRELVVEELIRVLRELLMMYS